jgi:hypothetical protein
MKGTVPVCVLLLASCGAFPQPAQNQNPDAATDAASSDTPGGAALEVMMFSPADNSAANQASATSVTATFAENLDCARITNTSLKVLDGATTVAGQVNCAGATLTFQPTAGVLPTATTLQATIDAGVSSIGGATVGTSRSWSFEMAPWTRQFGTAVAEAAQGVVVDGSGNVYVAGYTPGALDGNPNIGLTDAFVTKYTVTGVRQWTRQFGTTANDWATGIARDPAGNVVIAGYTAGDFHGSNAGFTDAFVIKYDASGTMVWKDQFGTAGAEYAQGVTTDSSGNVFVVGSGGDLDGQTSAGATDAFVVKYNASGTKQWTRLLGSAADDSATDAVTDPSGNVYFGGSTWGGIDGAINAGGLDVVVAKYNANGAKQWTRQLGGAGHDAANAVTLDASGYLYIGGETTGDFDGNTSAGGQDMVLIKYSDLGVKQYSRQLGSTANDMGYGIAVDLGGSPYVVGPSAGAFDGNTSAGMQDLIVVKFAPNGTKLWSKQSGTTAFDVAGAVAVSGDELLIAGTSAGAFDGSTNAGGADAIIVKYQQDGRKR